MTENAKLPAAPEKKRAPTLYFIVAIKLMKGVLLLLLALGVFSLANKNLPDLFNQFLRWVHLDPERSFFTGIGDWLDTVTPTNVRVVASGTLLYGLFLLVGGSGLAFRAKWAIWLAIGESAFFIPIEIFELVRHRLPNASGQPRPELFPHPKIGLAHRAGAECFDRLVFARKPETAVPASPLSFPRDRGAFLWHRHRVTITEAIQLLEKFRAGGVSRDQVLRAFQAAPVADLGFAQVDTHRALRKDFPEVIFGAGKTPEQVVKIAAKLLAPDQRVLVTRITAEHARALRKKFKPAVHHQLARCVTIEKKPLPKRPGFIAVVCAGTSDLPVAEEAAVTAEIMGNRVERDPRRRRGRSAPVVGADRKHIQRANVAHRRRRHGRRAAERRRRTGFQAGHRRADEHRLRRELRRHRGAARHVEQLRQRRDGGEH